jgi:hypothetical protein
MNVSNQQARSIGRLALEKAALKEVCACQYYDLRGKLSETSSLELIYIITHNYDCPMCGRKGA